MVSRGGDIDNEVFIRHFMLHNQQCRIRVDSVHHDCNYASFSFTPHHNESKGIMHRSMIKWSQSWHCYWFYTKVLGMNVTEYGEAKTIYHFVLRLIPTNISRKLDFKRRGHAAGEDIYYSAYYNTGSCDLVEEFCATRVRPLKDGFGIGNDQLASIDFEI